MDDVNTAKAYHEAAHAVFNFWLGCKIDYVSNERTEMLGRQTRLSDREMIMSLCSGIIGEEICNYEGDSLSADDLHGNHNLMEKCLAREYLRLVGEEEDAGVVQKWADHYGHQLLEEVRRVLNDGPWKRAVINIANEVAARERIDGSEVERIIEAALNEQVS